MPNTGKMPITHNQFVTRILGIVLAILSILIVLSGVLLSVRLVQYIKIDDKELNLTTNMDADFDLFSVEYTNAAGEITVSGAEVWLWLPPAQAWNTPFACATQTRSPSTTC